MLAIPQYALSWPDLLVSDICCMCLLLENIPHVCDANVSLFVKFVWYLMYVIFIWSISSTDSTLQFNLSMDRCVHEPLSFTVSRCHWMALRAHGCNIEPHVFLRVMLEIICSCFFYTNLSVAFLIYSVVRSLFACLVWCFVCIWFVIQSIEHHPLAVSFLPHAFLFLQPQQVSMQKRTTVTTCWTDKIIRGIVIDM